MKKHLRWLSTICSFFAIRPVRYDYLLVLSLTLFGHPKAWAQAQQASPEDLLPPRFIPKSPTASTLLRFDGQQLVHLPTGGAQLTVPVAEVTSGPLHLALALAYSYTGLKIAQPNDLVGLGWTLQAGGSITRQVNGLVDDLVASSPDQRFDAVAILTNVNDQQYLKKAFQSKVDTGPDVYSFSLPDGLNGRFVLRDTTVVLFPQQPVHIRPLGARSIFGFQGFQVTTEDGVRYQFLNPETTTPNPNNYGPVGPHYSAWQLTSLVAANNSDTLRLHYSAQGSQPLPQQCSVTTGRYYTGAHQDLGNNVDPNACGSQASYSFHNVTAFISRLKAQFLDSITTRGTSLILTRNDSSHEVRQLQLLATTGGRQIIKQVTLFQSLFTGGTATDYRLRLDSLRESANGTALPAYRFSYFGDTAPPRGSAAQDYWGYANGATQNGDYSTQLNPNLLADPHLLVAGRTPANRDPNFDAAVTGALRLVRYPTGGNTQWAYEPGRMRAPFEDIPLSYRQLDIGTGYNPDKAKSIPGGPRLPVTSSGVLTFQITQEADVNVGLYRQPSGDAPTGGTNTYQDFSIWQVLPTGNVFVTDPPDASAYRILDGQPTNREYVFHLLPGTYAAQVYCEIHEADSGIGFRIPYRDSTQAKLGLLGPGIRVAQTTTTAAGAPPLVRTYQYVVGGTSSGLSLLPDLGKGFDQYKSDTEYSSNNKTALTETRCTYENVSSDNRGLGNDYNKYDFYYTCVTEVNGTGQGTSVNYFTHQPDQFNDVVLTQQQLYQQAGSPGKAPQLVQRTRYDYASDSLANYPFLRVHDLLTYVITGNGDNGVPDNTYDPELYYVGAAFRAPSLTTLTHYDAQGNAATTLTRSTYQRQRLVRTATRGSTGWDIQTYKRLSDYAPLPAVTALRVNSFNPILETQTWYRSLDSPDSVLTAGHLTLYDPAWRSPARLYRLQLAQPVEGPNQETLANGRFNSLFSDSHYEPLASVRYAAGTGDLIQQQAAHGQPTSFLTGYDRTVVIAEAKNAAYNQVAYTSFEPKATGRWHYDSTGTHRVLVASRTGRWAYQLTGPGSTVRRGQLPAGDYELTIWVQGSPPALTLSGGQALGDWQFVATTPAAWQQYHARLHFTTTGQVSLEAPVGSPAPLLDELRLYPVGAQLTSYTYDPLIGVTSQTDPTGRLVTYEYDALGRLVRTRDEQGRILSQQQYHYAGTK